MHVLPRDVLADPKRECQSLCTTTQKETWTVMHSVLLSLSLSDTGAGVQSSPVLFPVHQNSSAPLGVSFFSPVVLPVHRNTTRGVGPLLPSPFSHHIAAVPAAPFLFPSRCSPRGVAPLPPLPSPSTLPQYRGSHSSSPPGAPPEVSGLSPLSPSPLSQYIAVVPGVPFLFPSWCSPRGVGPLSPLPLSPLPVHCSSTGGPILLPPPRCSPSAAVRHAGRAPPPPRPQIPGPPPPPAPRPGCRAPRTPPARARGAGAAVPRPAAAGVVRRRGGIRACRRRAARSRVEQGRAPGGRRCGGSRGGVWRRGRAPGGGDSGGAAVWAVTLAEGAGRGRRASERGRRDGPQASPVPGARRCPVWPALGLLLVRSTRRRCGNFEASSCSGLPPAARFRWGVNAIAVDVAMCVRDLLSVAGLN